MDGYFSLAYCAALIIFPFAKQADKKIAIR